MSVPTSPAGIRARLRDVYWVGGGSGAGKSTVARRLAATHGLTVYDTDGAMRDHAARAGPADAPWLTRFRRMPVDERWVTRSPETMLDTFHWFRGEAFGLIVSDLLRTEPRPVIAEGFRLLPTLVAPLLDDPAHAVWLLPTPGFRRVAFEARGGTWDIAGRTGDPERALHNLLERDRMFTDRLRAETARSGLPHVSVDGTRSEDELVDDVAARFGLPSAEPGAGRG